MTTFGGFLDEEYDLPREWVISRTGETFSMMERGLLRAGR